MAVLIFCVPVLIFPATVIALAPSSDRALFDRNIKRLLSLYAVFEQILNESPAPSSSQLRMLAQRIQDPDVPPNPGLEVLFDRRTRNIYWHSTRSGAQWVYQVFRSSSKQIASTEITEGATPVWEEHLQDLGVLVYRKTPAMIDRMQAWKVGKLFISSDRGQLLERRRIVRKFVLHFDAGMEEAQRELEALAADLTKDVTAYLKDSLPPRLGVTSKSDLNAMIHGVNDRFAQHGLENALDAVAQKMGMCWRQGEPFPGGRGSVELVISTFEHCLEVVIKDNGVGIPLYENVVYSEKIFSSFMTDWVSKTKSEFPHLGKKRQGLGQMVEWEYDVQGMLKAERNSTGGMTITFDLSIASIPGKTAALSDSDIESFKKCMFLALHPDDKKKLLAKTKEIATAAVRLGLNRPNPIFLNAPKFLAQEASQQKENLTALVAEAQATGCCILVHGPFQEVWTSCAKISQVAPDLADEIYGFDADALPEAFRREVPAPEAVLPLVPMKLWADIADKMQIEFKQVVRWGKTSGRYRVALRLGGMDIGDTVDRDSFSMLGDSITMGKFDMRKEYRGYGFSERIFERLRREFPDKKIRVLDVLPGSEGFVKRLIQKKLIDFGPGGVPAQEYLGELEKILAERKKGSRLLELQARTSGALGQAA